MHARSAGRRDLGPRIGFVTSLDSYPGMDTGEPRMFQAALFFQLGL